MHTDSETGLQLAPKHTDLEPGTQLPPEMHNDPKPELLAVPLHSDPGPVEATVQEEKLAMSAQKPGGSLLQKITHNSDAFLLSCFNLQVFIFLYAYLLGI